MNWVRDVFQKIKAWGDAFLGEWFDPTPIQDIEGGDSGFVH